MVVGALGAHAGLKRGIQSLTLVVLFNDREFDGIPSKSFENTNPFEEVKSPERTTISQILVYLQRETKSNKSKRSNKAFNQQLRRQVITTTATAAT